MTRFPATRLAVAGLLATAALTACQPNDGALWLKWPSAIDGDTLNGLVDGVPVRVRLCGIDASELRDEDGVAAKRTLAALIRSDRVTCIPVGSGTPCDGRSPKTSHGRIVAQCFNDLGDDVAEVMVLFGMARDWPEFSGGYYGR